MIWGLLEYEVEADDPVVSQKYVGGQANTFIYHGVQVSDKS